jgi:hypothetical protein
VSIDAFLAAHMHDDDDAAEIKRLLRQAAALATAHSIGGEDFIVSAWKEYLGLNPAKRAELQDKADRARIELARRRGRIALA